MKHFYNIGRFLCLFATLVFLFNGCATIFHGSTDKVDFSSDPSGAKVYVNGQYMGTAPLQLNLASKHTYTIEFRKDGYESRNVIINSSVGAGWIVLDVIFGLVPVIIDAATGSWNSLDQEHVNGALEQQQTK